MPTRFATAVAMLLALIGQAVGVVGLPVPRGHSATASTPDSECGCCPMDRAAKVCCCSKGAQSAEPVIEPVKSCCATKHKDPTPIRINWVSPVLRQQCHGPNDTANPGTLPASIPPAPPAGWQFDSADAGGIAMASAVAWTFDTVPDAPPPKLHFHNA